MKRASPCVDDRNEQIEQVVEIADVSGNECRGILRERLVLGGYSGNEK